MPTYEYRCDDCGKSFSVEQAISAHHGRSPACPKCQSRRTAQQLSASYVKTVKKS